MDEEKFIRDEYNDWHKGERNSSWCCLEGIGVQ